MAAELLSSRKASLLRIIIGEYIAAATPVGSERIVQTYRLGISPATIRNDMAELEEAGYITHPHTSAGRVPSDKGYRYYVESLMETPSLPLSEQLLVRHQFHQLARQLEEWTALAVAILARLVHNLGMITIPKEPQSRVRRLELVSLHEFLAMLVLILEETKLKREIVPLSEPASQEKLDSTAARLNELYAGLSTNQVEARDVILSPLESQVLNATIRVMRAEDSKLFDLPTYEGLRHFLGQPEVTRSSKMLDIVEALEDRSLLNNILPDWPGESGVQVVIGRENRQPLAQECSLVLTRYGVGSASGYLGVLGPTRMDYRRTIAIVRYIASMMNELLAEVH